MYAFPIFVAVILLPFLNALPHHQSKRSANPEEPLPLFTFDKGGVGVNFGGYHASAGLGGLLTGNAADGGLFAKAGTPTGQNAGAGLGGVVSSDEGAVGGLYAGATAGGGVSAAAGLAGATNGESTHITKFAAKSSPSLTKIKEVEFQEEALPKPQTTYVQKTVIPNYVEKTIQVPSYVEKTVRVPTFVEQRVRVPVEPTIVEEEIEVPVQKVVQKTKIKTKTHHGHSRIRVKNVSWGGAGIGTGAAYAPGVESGAVGASGTATFSAAKSPEFFQNIFNIPISTLSAVSKLVSGIAGGVSGSGSLAVSKSYAVA